MAVAAGHAFFRESTWASASCGLFHLYSLGIHHFWICDVRGDIPTCNLQYLFMDLLYMNLSLSLNYVEVNPFGIVVQGLKLGAFISEFWFLNTK